MRRVACLAFTMCAFSCHGEKPETVLTVVEHHEPDRVVDTELGTLTLADQSWGFQKHIEDDGQPLEVFYRAEVSIELDEKAEGFEVVVPYEISVQTSSRAQQNSETKSQGASLEPDAPPRGLALTNATSFRDSLSRNPLWRGIPRFSPRTGPGGMSGGMGFGSRRVILKLDAPWAEARTTIEFAGSVSDPALATLLDSLSIDFHEPLLFPAGTTNWARSQ